MTDINYHGPVVVFDLDDTLYPEADFAISGYREIARAVLPEKADDIVKVMTGALYASENPMDKLAEFLNGIGSGDLVDKARWVDIYRNQFPDIELYPDAKECLQTLAACGIRMGLITDGRSIGQRNKIKALGLTDFIPEHSIFISEETGKEKPDAYSYKKFVHQYPEAAGFVYIGDNTAKDFITPNRLGWLTIRREGDFRNIFKKQEADKLHSAKHDVKSLLDAVDILMKKYGEI